MQNTPCARSLPHPVAASKLLSLIQHRLDFLPANSNAIIRRTRDLVSPCCIMTEPSALLEAAQEWEQYVQAEQRWERGPPCGCPRPEFHVEVMLATIGLDMDTETLDVNKLKRRSRLISFMLHPDRVQHAELQGKLRDHFAISFEAVECVNDFLLNANARCACHWQYLQSTKVTSRIYFPWDPTAEHEDARALPPSMHTSLSLRRAEHAVQEERFRNHIAPSFAAAQQCVSGQQQLKATLETLTEDNAALQQNAAVLQEQGKHLNERLREAREGHRTSSKEVETLKIEIAALRDEKEVLASELEREQQMRRTVRKALKALEDKLSTRFECSTPQPTASPPFGASGGGYYDDQHPIMIDSDSDPSALKDFASGKLGPKGQRDSEREDEYDDNIRVASPGQRRFPASRKRKRASRTSGRCHSDEQG